LTSAIGQALRGAPRSSTPPAGHRTRARRAWPAEARDLLR
jgi:hypothetical protein